VWWFIEGEDWTDELRALLAQCLDRMTYFGRAETFTRVGVVGSTDDIPAPNCTLVDKRAAGVVVDLLKAPSEAPHCGASKTKRARSRRSIS
jgi:hypothetical protein